MRMNRNHENEMGISLYLCKPNREEIDSLNSIENIVVKKSLNQLNELSFSIPATLNINHRLVDNPLIKKIRHKYLVKELHKGKTYYYLVSKRSKKYNNKTKTMDYTLYGLMKQIGDEINYEFEEDGKTLKELSDLALENTLWKTGYVDGDVAYKQRSYETSQENKLQTILNLAEKFNVVPVPNDEKRVIDYYSADRLRTNRGITFEKNHYLESFNIDYGEEIITKLYVYGDEGLTISRTTATGAEFIVDYSYYLYPFEQDSSDNIINHSYYMSDELCIAWINYQKKLKANEGKVESLTKQIEEIEKEYFDVAFELSEQQIEIRKVKDHLDILKSTRAPEEDIEAERQVLAREESKFNEIAKRVESTEKKLDNTTEQKKELVKTLSLEHNLSKSEIEELTEFTTRKNVTNSTIVDDEDLLTFAKDTMKKINQPPINLSLSLEDFKSRISSDTIVENIQLGDEVFIYSKQLDVNVKTQILNITYNVDNNSVQVTTSNALEINQPQDLYDKILFGATGTSTTVEMDKHKWEEGSEAKDAVSKILNGVWDATKNAIVGGVNQSVVINERGLTITSSEDPLKKLVAQNGVLALTKDGGNSWRTAITPDGVYAEELVGRIIMGNKLHIEDEKGIITIVGSKQTIFDKNKNEKIVLGEYATNKYGIKINDGAIELHTKGKGQVGITIDGNGIVAKDSSGKTQFSLDNNGNLVANNGHFKGTITSSTMSNSEIKGGSINIGNNFIVDEYGNLTSTTISKNNKDIYSKIEQTETKITQEVNSKYIDLNGKIYETNSKIEQTAKSITSTVNANYTELNGKISSNSSKIEQTASSITSTVTTNYKELNDKITENKTDADKKLSDTNKRLVDAESEFKQTAKSITSTVNANYEDLDGKITNNRSEIKQLDDEISMKVDVDGVISAINLSDEGVKIKGKNIDLEGTVTVLSDISGKLGDIYSGNIDISEDVTIGKNLTFKVGGRNFITFADQTYLSSDGSGGLLLTALNDVYLDARRINLEGDVKFLRRSTVNFNGADVIGLDISGYAKGHTDGIGIAYSSGSQRLYVRINGNNVGYVNLEG